MFCMNRTSSMPKSVICYDVDKDLTSFWNSVFTQSCSPNKEQDLTLQSSRSLTSLKQLRDLSVT